MPSPSTIDFLLVTLRYALDWVLVIGFTLAAGFLGNIDGARRPFNPYDPAFSFPYHDDTVSVIQLGIVAILGPAVIMMLCCLLAPRSILPALANYPNAPSSLVWKHKLLNWNRAWLGLGLTDALAFFISNCLKNVFGKPRPHMISVCKPDWDRVAEIIKTTRTGPQGILAWNPLVTSEICTTTDHEKLSEAFRSFPSGHSAMSFSGLTFLSLFLYSTLVLTLRSTSTTKLPYSNADIKRSDESNEKSSSSSDRASKLHPPSLPLITFVVVIAAFCLAMWIAATRYLDFKHAGIDIFSGSLLGFFSAICGTWWYAMPAAGGVAKGRIRSGYRDDFRMGRRGVADGDYDREPRGPISAGEGMLLGHRESVDENDQPKFEPQTSRPMV
ncbi:hypothetical protein TWF106_007912 [Orbilia oligospora]|uniref:Phosphatidic acid phosphatase type 2/haloperoxidase domain-containing protein n=1 Tax=Orbilia oligospora TaxID=2813651 RepID=A0A6G1M537_ORBOL|nr:hypothetical protein TWF679_011091 [Orbilia oligospora]KAF3217606.1 hypothetical protein TWF106_007912 [Orbilia oligospora]KAF3225002.1 hypothetical protein TWF191_005850 [Orbilia oligospora]KAF3245811.1 hypothetical protein TWF192_007287 [Orbilia oligospora]